MEPTKAQIALDNPALVAQVNELIYLCPTGRILSSLDQNPLIVEADEATLQQVGAIAGVTVQKTSKELNRETRILFRL